MLETIPLIWSVKHFILKWAIIGFVEYERTFYCRNNLFKFFIVTSKLETLLIREIIRKTINSRSYYKRY